MVYCAVVGCYNNSNRKNTTEKVSSFRLPFDESHRKTWLSKIRRQDLPANYNSTVFAIYIRIYGYTFIYMYILPLPEKDPDALGSNPDVFTIRLLLHVQQCNPTTFLPNIKFLE